MKKIIGLIAIAICSIDTYSQATEYSELGAMISDDSHIGTARFSAMGGAFGAIGGDLSSVTINPAGAAVSTHSRLSFSLTNNTKSTESNFLQQKLKTKNPSFNFSNANGSMAFNCSEKSKWERVTLFFNFQLKNNFKSNFDIESDKQITPFFQNNFADLNDNITYDKLTKMTFQRTRRGVSSVVNLGIAALSKDDLYLGSSINFHSFDIIETNELTEDNESNTGNKSITAFNSQEISLGGDGVSLSLGGIYKIEQFRVGLSFETPTFYSEITETSNIYQQDDDIDIDGYTEIKDDNWEFKTNDEEEEPIYNFRSPLNLTTSVAYIFAKKGLISLDYSYKNYSSMNFSEDGNFFKDENKYISKVYNDASALNIGTEWRFNKLKIRAGYEYKQDPNSATKDDNSINSISTGLGYSYRNLLFDLSYTKRTYNRNYNLYNTNDILNINNASRISGTLTFLM